MQKSVPLLVQPSRPTPYEVIPFTHGSVVAGLNTLASNHLLVFRPGGPEEETGRQVMGSSRRPPADIIRSGLSQVLVPYYPLAGRIVPNETGWEVHCNGRGAVFIVTTSPDVLLDDTTTPVPERHMISEEAIPIETVVMPPPPPAPLPPEAPVLTIQVTELSGGGFVLSIKLYRGICDTAGLIHFLCGWAEMSRGKQQISVMPLWKEKQLHMHSMSPTTTDSDTNYRVHFPSLEMGSSTDHVHGIDQDTFVCNHHNMVYRPSTSETLKLEVPLEMIKAMVDWLQVEESCPCSAPQALAAHVWRERTRSLQISDNEETRLFFLSKAQERYPVAYYGSFAFNCQSKAVASELVGAPLSHAVRIIQAAEATLMDDFTACTAEFKRVHCTCGYTPQEVLVFTNLPSTSSTTSKLDFGVVAKPVPPSETIYFPPHLNIAAVAPPPSPPTSDPYTLHIFMNNVPFVVAHELRSLICNLPVYISQDSRM